VNAESATSTRVVTSSQTKCSDRLRTSAPGSSPISQRTWKPLQVPMTSFPFRASFTTLGMIGENRAIAPHRR
jgi:hypothetical protein